MNLRKNFVTFQVFVLPFDRSPGLGGGFPQAVAAQPVVHGSRQIAEHAHHQLRRDRRDTLHGHGLHLRSAAVVKSGSRRVPPDQERQSHEHLQTGK